MASLATTKEVTTTETKPDPQWVALIYYPALERKNPTNDHLISGLRQGELIPFMRYFQFVLDNEINTIQVHPGTNLGYHFRSVGDNREVIRKLPYSWFRAIFDQKANKRYLDSGVIVPFYPVDGSDLDGQPTYSSFSDQDALVLVGAHTHEKWVDLAMIPENRAVIKTAAEARKQEILNVRRKQQEGAI